MLNFTTVALAAASALLVAETRAELPIAGNSDISVSYKMASEDEVEFEIGCKTNQWVGLTLGSSSMRGGTDMIVYNCADGTVKDMYSRGYTTPALDSKQNIEVVGESAGSDGTTGVQFRRKLDTGDSDDFLL